MLGYTPVGRHPPGIHPPWADTPPQTDIPHDTTRYGQQAGGTHPTGMHTCFDIDIFYGVMTRFHKFKIKCTIEKHASKNKSSVFTTFKALFPIH